jgi:hypothetical protein
LPSLARRRDSFHKYREPYIFSDEVPMDAIVFSIEICPKYREFSMIFHEIFEEIH